MQLPESPEEFERRIRTLTGHYDPMVGVKRNWRGALLGPEPREGGFGSPCARCKVKLDSRNMSPAVPGERAPRAYGAPGFEGAAACDSCVSALTKDAAPAGTAAPQPTTPDSTLLSLINLV